eukprot:m.287216 g.287216  ORF g.287216 m.287216 type:complete len:407 (+) comp11730_c0_seq1:464-1684(+)
MGHLAREVDKVLGHGVPLLGKHPVEHLTLLGVTEDGGLVLLVEVLVRLKVGGHLGPVGDGRVVVDDVVVLVPDVVAAVENGDRVDVLVGGIIRVDPGVPHVADAGKEEVGLAVGKEQVEERERPVPAPGEGHKAVEEGHAVKLLEGECVLAALAEHENRRDAHPVEGEAGHVDKEAVKVGAIEVQVGVDIVDVVVPAVVDLVVADAVRVGNLAVDRAGDPLHPPPVEDLQGTLPHSEVVVALLVNEHVQMRKEAEAGPNAQKVVHQEGRDFKAVRRVARIRPVEPVDGPGAEEENPGDVRVVAGIAQEGLAGRNRKGADEVGEALEKRDGIVDSLHEEPGAVCSDNEDGHGGANEEHLQHANGRPDGVGDKKPRKGMPLGSILVLDKAARRLALLCHRSHAACAQC